MTNKLTSFYLVRHGETEWNVLRLIQGHSDSPLTQKGIEQIKNLAEELKGVTFDYVFSSDLLRAKRTAEAIVLNRKLEITTTKLLRERNFGKLEKSPSTEFKKVDEILDKLTEEERRAYKYGDFVESDNEILERFFTFARELAITHPGRNILAVTHGGFIRTILLRLGYGNYAQLRHGAIKNGAVVRIESDGVDFFVKEVKGVELNGETK